MATIKVMWSIMCQPPLLPRMFPGTSYQGGPICECRLINAFVLTQNQSTTKIGHLKLTSLSGYEDLSAVIKEILKFVMNRFPEIPFFRSENGANIRTLSAPIIVRSPEIVKQISKCCTSIRQLLIRCLIS